MNSKIVNALRWVAVLPVYGLCLAILDEALYYVLAILDWMGAIAMGSYGSGQSSPLLLRMIACGFQLFLSVYVASLIAPSGKFGVSLFISVLYLLAIVFAAVFLPTPENASALEMVLCSVSSLVGCGLACAAIKEKE